MKMFSLKIKKIIAVVCIFILILSFFGCTVPTYKAPKDKVVASLGEYESREFFTCGGFQDYTDYAKYYYTSAKVSENECLKKIQETDLASINTHLDDFDGWVEASDPSGELVANYDFDRKIIDTEDYFYIDSEEHRWSTGEVSLVSYDVYIFDTQTKILYFFHNNI